MTEKWETSIAKDLERERLAEEKRSWADKLAKQEPVIVEGDTTPLICALCGDPIKGTPYKTVSYPGNRKDYHVHCAPSARVPAEDLQSAITEAAEQPGVKYDSEKARWDLLPWLPTSKVVDVLTYGARKYSPDNWQLVPHYWERYTSAAMRHLSAYLQGQKIDPESGHAHLAHAICCLLFLLWFDAKGSK